MESEVKQRKKIVFSDNGVDVAITGIVIAEDDFFLEVLSDSGRRYKIGKKAITVIKEVQ